jgi:hypothetical protein
MLICILSPLVWFIRIIHTNVFSDNAGVHLLCSSSCISAIRGYLARDARIRAEKADLARLRQVKRGLMDDLLTGRILLSLLVVTPLGFLSKLYAGPARGWFNNYAVGVLATMSALEVLQPWPPGLLEQIRSTFLGQALLGTTFAWWDFPHYVLGCALGWLWMLKIGM